MELCRKTIFIFAIVAATALISTLTVSQSADAWHSIFSSRDECLYFLKTEYGNTTHEADVTCDKIVPHTISNNSGS